MRLDLRPETQDESTPGLSRKIPSGIGEVGGRPREGNGNRRPETQPCGVFGDQCAGKKWIVLRLRGPEGIESDRFGDLGDMGDVFQADLRKAGIQAHDLFTPWAIASWAMPRVGWHRSGGSRHRSTCFRRVVLRDPLTPGGRNRYGSLGAVVVSHEDNCALGIEWLTRLGHYGLLERQ